MILPHTEQAAVSTPADCAFSAKSTECVVSFRHFAHSIGTGSSFTWEPLTQCCDPGKEGTALTNETPPDHITYFDEKKVTYFYNQLVRRALKDVVREIMAWAYELGRQDGEKERHET